MVRKGEIACNNVLYSIGYLFFILNALENVICNLFQFGMNEWCFKARRQNCGHIGHSYILTNAKWK